MSGSAPKSAAAELRSDLENIRQAWQWAVKEGWVAGLQQAIDGLSRYYDQCGLFQEGRSVFGEAATILQEHASTFPADARWPLDTVINRLKIEQADFITQ